MSRLALLREPHDLMVEANSDVATILPPHRYFADADEADAVLDQPAFHDTLHWKSARRQLLWVEQFASSAPLSKEKNNVVLAGR